MYKENFVYLICYHDSTESYYAPYFVSAHSDSAQAYKECAYKNKHYSLNAIPNPNYRKNRSSSFELMMKKDKTKRAAWYYVKTVKVE